MGEGFQAARRVLSHLAFFAEKEQWDDLSYALQPWSSELRTRMEIATMRFRLYGSGARIGGRYVHESLVSAVESMKVDYRDHKRPDVRVLDDALQHLSELIQDFEKEFVGAVTPKLK